MFLRSHRHIIFGATLLWVSQALAAAPTNPVTSGVEPPAGQTVSPGTINRPVPVEEPDQKITDLELRAQAGSRSRYSLKFVLGYSGPQLTQLDREEQPNPNNSPGRYLTNISGSAGLSYRLTSSETLYLSTGVRAYTPFSGLSEEEFNDPSLTYANTFRLAGMQARSTVWGAATTTRNYVDRGQQAALGVSQALKWQPGDSRWWVGLSLSATTYIFDREFRPEDGKVSNYYLTAIPSLEYRVTDDINLNTSVALPWANLRRSGGWSRLDQQLASARVGLGWAITPEIYINPYIGFFPDEPDPDNASLSLNTVFSVF